MIARYPRPQKRHRSAAAEADIAPVMTVVSGIRSIRSEFQIPPSRTLSVVVKPAPAAEPVLRAEAAAIGALARADVRIDPAADRAADAVLKVVEGSEIHVSLAGVVDVRGRASAAGQGAAEGRGRARAHRGEARARGLPSAGPGRGRGARGGPAHRAPGAPGHLARGAGAARCARRPLSPRPTPLSRDRSPPACRAAASPGRSARMAPSARPRPSRARGRTREHRRAPSSWPTTRRRGGGVAGASWTAPAGTGPPRLHRPASPAPGGPLAGDPDGGGLCGRRGRRDRGPGFRAAQVAERRPGRGSEGRQASWRKASPAPRASLAGGARNRRERLAGRGRLARRSSPAGPGPSPGCRRPSHASTSSP